MVKFSPAENASEEIGVASPKAWRHPSTARAAAFMLPIANSVEALIPNQQILKLTAKEFAFMKALCSRCGDIVQREGLAEILACQRSSFDKRHLDTVVSRLRRKIEDQSRLPAPIMVVYGVGYTFTATAAVA
ncbi:Transcriptional regulatory protein OmpR [compost metagenome]